MKAGEYVLAGLGSRQIIKKIAAGQTAPVEFTIIPGWTLSDVADYLAQKRIVERGPFLEYTLGEAGAGTDNFSSLRSR